MVYALEKRYFFWTIPQIAVSSAMPLITVYFPKVILEKLTSDAKTDYGGVLTAITAFAGCLFVLRLFSAFASRKIGQAADSFSAKVQYALADACTRLDLCDIEMPDTRDTIQLAQRASGITGVFALVQNMVSTAISIIGLSVILSRLDVIFYMVIAAVLLVKTVFSVWQYRCNKRVRGKFAEIDRTGGYLDSLVYVHHGAQKEIRVNDLYEWFMTKVRAYRTKMLGLQYRDFRRNGLFGAGMLLCVAAQTVIVLLLLAGKYSAGTISIAEFTMYFSAVTSLTSLLAGFTSQLESYNEQLLNLGDYNKILAMIQERSEADTAENGSQPVSDEAAVIFENVSFAYPLTEKNVLENVNLTVKNKEKLVIVGLNGSGKSTLIKLLCKFYKPSSGRILFNGTDIWSIPNEEYYKELAAVFQDYYIFAFSVSENIALQGDPDVGAILRAAASVGMEDTVRSFPQGLDTVVSRVFATDGIELSGGEGQKLAILRALYKDAPLLILDEPTASLDAKIESEIYEDFLRASSEKTTIFISHRLAASTLADHIAVFSQGKMIEYGTHAELMSCRGLYAEMFEKQSAHYVEAK